MAASVDNRQYGLVDPGRSAVVHGYRSSPNTRSYADHVFPKKLVQMDDSSSEDETEYDWSSNHVTKLYKEVEGVVEPSILDSRDQGTADNWIERNRSLIRLTGKHPFNCEPPLTQLMRHGFITPVPLHYVRNHGAVPMATWDEWTVEVTGLLKRPTRFTMDQLVNDFPSREFPVTLVCAGNRRKEQNMVKHTIGFNWGAAGVSTTVWRGVRLRDVLKRCGIYSHRKGAMNVCFEGAEDLPGGGGSKYGTSIKREFAMDPSRDIILAYMQNGELLTPDHGFPIRMIIPGFIGGRMVKWLKRIVVTTRESENYYHYKDNRVLPSHVDAELANAEAWWYKPEYIINELNVNSVITTPCHEEMLPINSSTTRSSYTLKGYAYSGGGRKITRVELTMDEGESWMVCNLDIQEKPNKYGKYWCWCFWSLEVEVVDLIGVKEIAVRAWDESLNTQPEKLNWNVMGMMNNCWFRVKMNVCKPQKGEIGIMFEHPTQPANQSGGWMTRQKHPETSESTATNAMKKNTSSTSSAISMSEVNKHNSAESAWIVVHGQVYDCTRFLNDHPGGSDSILINAGTDCTEEFDAIHSERGKKMLEDYRIGELVTTTTGLTNSAPPRVSINETVTPKKNVALIPGEKIKCKMISKIHLSHDSRLFRFALPSEEQVLGLPVGKHIYVCATIDDKLCMRAYTPSSSDDEVGYFDLVIKVYFKGVNPKFPNGGLMSQFLDNLPLGATVDIKGPLGHIEYTGQGNFLVHGKNKSAKKLAMIAGGTGITPIYQVIQAILKDPKDETEMYLVYANRTEDDILLRDELDSWAEKHERLKVWYVVGKSIREGWKYSVGIVSESILREHLPGGSSDALALACGPPPMIQFAVTPNLEKMNFDVKNSLLVF